MNRAWLLAIPMGGLVACTPLPSPECLALDPACAKNEASVVVELRGLASVGGRVWASAGQQERATQDIPSNGTVTFYFFDVPRDAPVAAGTGDGQQGRRCALGQHARDGETWTVDIQDAARCTTLGTRDAGEADAATTDASAVDAHSPDSGTQDGGTPDAGRDGGEPDASEHEDAGDDDDGGDDHGDSDDGGSGGGGDDHPDGGN